MSWGSKGRWRRVTDGLMASARELQPVEAIEQPGRTGIVRFVHDIARFVRLAEHQGTRLVDVLERWAIAAERNAAATERHAVATERLADAMGAKEADDGAESTDGNSS